MQAKVIKYFIKSAPVGEVNLVLNDVKNITGEKPLEEPEIKQFLKEHFESHRQHIKLSDGRVAMVTDIGRNNPIQNEDGTITDFVYFDTKLGVKFSFDPKTLVATIHGTESDFPEALDEQWLNYK
jgi:hypothetical protein